MQPHLLDKVLSWLVVCLKTGFWYRDLVRHSGGHRHSVCDHQRLCDRRHLRLHPSSGLRLQVWTVCWSGASRGRVRTVRLLVIVKVLLAFD